MGAVRSNNWRWCEMKAVISGDEVCSKFKVRPNLRGWTLLLVVTMRCYLGLWLRSVISGIGSNKEHRISRGQANT